MTPHRRPPAAASEARAMRAVAVMLMLGCAAALALSGCAPGAQTVKLAPETEQIEERERAEPAGLALRVIDRRPREIFGYRDEAGGVTLAGEPALAEAVRDGLATAFERQGIAVTEWDGEAERRLEVEIYTFDYERSGGFLNRRASLKSAWMVSGMVDGERYSSEARVSTETRALFGPGEAKNEELVNRVLSRGVRQVATQKDLLRLLEGET
ncbi:hypothetical protein CCR79_02670 [Halorhodospira halophila]|nr:hypothetical protein [Halorhodospira halophila]